VEKMSWADISEEDDLENDLRFAETFGKTNKAPVASSKSIREKKVVKPVFTGCFKCNSLDATNFTEIRYGEFKAICDDCNVEEKFPVGKYFLLKCHICFQTTGKMGMFKIRSGVSKPRCLDCHLKSDEALMNNK
jgi:hypothetical protein